MLTVKQIAAIIKAEIEVDEYERIFNEEIAAQKIYDLCRPDHDIHVAAAALENEVTSTLIDMTVATVLGTLINEEGGGRTNVRISTGSMQEVLAEWDYKVVMEGMVRNVRITPKNLEAWDNEKPASKLESLLAPVADTHYTPEDLTPQAEPREYNRPLWAITRDDAFDGRVCYLYDSQKEATEAFRKWNPEWAMAKNARIENRWCLHPECPASGCNRDASKRDSAEATSDE